VRPCTKDTLFEGRESMAHLAPPILCSIADIALSDVSDRLLSPFLTVLIPVYNEKRTLDTLLERVIKAPYPDKQIIVIDDGSTDGTWQALEHWADVPRVTLLRHSRNRGKGAAVRTGLESARGEVTIVQDADLEYDPEEYERLVEPILARKAEVVYGSRYLNPAHRPPWSRFRVAVILLNGMVRVLYGRRLTDEATCYKAVRTRLLRSLDLKAERFELCPEITAKLCRRGVAIMEVPISYHPRSSAQGKKIRWRDAWQAAWTLVKWRL
jgi:dolichol-phosphate mannosyltransferase